MIWTGMSPEDVLAALESVPVVLGRWVGWGGKPVEDSSGRFFARYSAEAVTMLRGSVMASVQPTGDGWHWSLGYGKDNWKGGFATAVEALADADREMRARGWLLMGDTPVRMQSEDAVPGECGR